MVVAVKTNVRNLYCNVYENRATRSEHIVSDFSQIDSGMAKKCSPNFYFFRKLIYGVML